MVTIKDIARESGYSVTTVSRVLNNRRDVSPVAKAKIEEIVEKYHFIPNNNAKHLKQSVSKTIVIVVKGIQNMMFAGIVEEIQLMVEKTKYTSLVSYLDELDNEVTHAIQVCREKKPLGILFLGGNPEYFEQYFSQVEVPCVLVTNRGNKLNFSNLSSVATDDIEGGKQVIDYLLQQGHQKIGIIGGDIIASHTSAQRFKGCMRAFDKHKIDFDQEKNYVVARFSFDSAYRAMERMLIADESITAVFAMSDVMAIGAIRALKDHGKNVPQDLSVIGYDGTTLADFYNPKLATVQQQYKTLARRSVEILFHQIDFHEEAVHEVVPFHMIAGESVKNIGKI